MAEVAAPPLKDLTAQLVLFRDQYLYRWMRSAQKRAVIAWRDRREYPGLAFRFSDEGKRRYGFSDRTGRYDNSKHYAPDYVNTGRFRDALLARQPKSVNTGGDTVITRFSIFGGALNLMGSQRGVVNEVRKVERKRVQKLAHQRRTKTGKTVNVRGYEQWSTFVNIERTHAARTYRDEWSLTAADLAWIADETSANFRATITGGKLTSRGFVSASARAQFRAALAEPGEAA